MSYGKNITSTFLTEITKIVLGFITSIMVTRALGPDGYGYVGYLMLIFGFISSYGHLGLNYATMYFQKKTIYSEEKVYCVNISVILIIFTVISTSTIFLKIGRYIFKDYSIFMILGGLIFVGSTLIFDCNRKFYVGNERIVELNKYLLISNFIKAFLIILTWIFRKLSPTTYFIIHIGDVIFKNTLVSYKLNMKYRFMLDKKLIKAEYKYGIIVYFSAVFIYLNYKADQILIKKMLGISELGIYSIGVSLAELLFLIPISVRSALNGKLYNLNNGSNKKRLLISMTIKYTFYISLVLAIAGIALTPLIPKVYGNEFKDASTVTAILFVGVAFASIGKVAYSYFLSEGKPIIHLKITLITFILNMILNFILIPLLGINGAAMASTIAYILYGFIYIIYFIREEHFLLNELIGFNYFDYNLIKKNTKED